MPGLTQEQLKSLLHYDPDTGVFTNRVTRHRLAQKGTRAGSKTRTGYVEIGLAAKRFYAHRLAFLYMTGEWPKQYVDHRDGDGTNNRWKNLRDVAPRVNQQNMRRARGNTASGLMGAHSVGERFKSSISVDGKTIRLGYFDTAEDAHAAYIAAKRVHHEGCTV